MMMIPFVVSDDEYSVFVILEKENVERMRDNDPAQINIWKMPDQLRKRRLRDVILASPSSEDVAKAITLVNDGQTQKALTYLSRGFKFKPKEGDSDLPYGAIRPQ